MRAFERYRVLPKENEELREAVRNLDNNLNDTFRYLLEKINELHEVKKNTQSCRI
jgi:phosphate uptake regulator